MLTGVHWNACCGAAATCTLHCGPSCCHLSLEVGCPLPSSAMLLAHSSRCPFAKMCAHRLVCLTLLACCLTCVCVCVCCPCVCRPHLS